MVVKLDFTVQRHREGSLALSQSTSAESPQETLSLPTGCLQPGGVPFRQLLASEEAIMKHYLCTFHPLVNGGFRVDHIGHLKLQLLSEVPGMVAGRNRQLAIMKNCKDSDRVWAGKVRVLSQS